MNAIIKLSDKNKNWEDERCKQKQLRNRWLYGHLLMQDQCAKSLLIWVLLRQKINCQILTYYLRAHMVVKKMALETTLHYSPV